MKISFYATWRRYPPQFWLMFAGMLISTIGSSMIWPFLMIYVSERLGLPLAAVAALMTVNSIAGLVSSFVAGPVVDRAGRKGAMVFSLAANGLGYLLLGQAQTLPVFAALMALQGAVQPVYRVGADAMMADLVPSEHRSEGYSLMRLANNVGIALGPAVGGFLAAVSYSISFGFAAAGLVLYSLLILFFARETLPNRDARVNAPGGERFGGYGRIFKDRNYMVFLLGFTLNQICASIVWVLLSVYTKQNFGMSENLYGFIPATNAIMVVALQLWVTARSIRFKPVMVMAAGAVFYAIAGFSVALGQGFWWFWGSMVIMTLGELMIVPTSTTFTANLAPADMRGRYMSLYSLCWPVASGIGPVMGGWLNDHIAPTAIWYGAGIAGSLAVVVFLWMRVRQAKLVGLAPE